MRHAGIVLAAALVVLVALVAPGSIRADDLSGADKLRVIWSNQFSFTADGVPLVTVGLADGREYFTVKGARLRVLPDGEGGAEVRGGATWTVRLIDGKPASVRWHVVVASALPDGGDRLEAEAESWRKRGYVPHTFELGAVFGLRGEVIDMRKLLLAVSPQDSAARGKAEAQAIRDKFHVETSLHPEVIARPRGYVEARDELGTVVHNDGVIWFAPSSDTGQLALDAPSSRPATGETAAPELHRSYGGKLYVTVGSDGKLAAANAVPEDKLLAGLLPAEIGAGAPPEALKAQAVAARNELYAKIGTRHLTDPYRLCADVHCQVYAGAGREDPRASAAVAATRGELLVRADGTLVDTVYSAACGGHTEDNDRAWAAGPEPSLRGVLDVEESALPSVSRYATVGEHEVDSFLDGMPARASCAAAGNFRWNARVEAAAVEAKADLGHLRDVVLLERGVSGRVVKLRLVGERGAKEIRGELEIRRLFGGLKSALFVLTVERDAAGNAVAFQFKGGGHGHGVGMCQAGAIGMADKGHSYRQILERYYRAAKIRRFY